MRKLIMQPMQGQIKIREALFFACHFLAEVWEKTNNGTSKSAIFKGVDIDHRDSTKYDTISRSNFLGNVCVPSLERKKCSMSWRKPNFAKPACEIHRQTHKVPSLLQLETLDVKNSMAAYNTGLKQGLFSNWIVINDFDFFKLVWNIEIMKQLLWKRFLGLSKF